MTINARVILPCVLVWLVSAPALAQSASAVFVVRHAERADAGAAPGKTDPDPELSAIGHARAEALATSLADAGITAIFVTHLKRTQQTAAPLAKKLGLTPVVIDANDTPALIARVKAHAGSALVVGHSNTVPDIVKRLGVATPVTVADDEFDRLFVVTRTGGDVQLIPLRFR